MSSNTRLRVAICGGGVAGLTLAYQLSKSPDVHIDIYEAASRFAELGAGITIPKRPRLVFAEMGLEEEFLAAAGNPPLNRANDLQYWRADSGSLEHVYDKTAATGGVVSVHRADFHNLLLRNLPSRTQACAGKRLVRYTEPAHVNEPIVLTFADGTEATCDILVGADGIKSVVRAQMLEELAVAAEKNGNESEAAKLREARPPRFSGTTSYRTIMPREKLESVAPDHPILSGAHRMYLGKNKMIITFPIAKGKLVNVGVTVMDYSREDTLHPEPWGSQGDAVQINKLFDGWAPEAKNLISCMEGCDIKCWIVNSIRPLSSHSTGRVALLGDAAHAMPPYLGAGAGSAVEDAYTLATILAHPGVSPTTAAEALRVYSDARQPVTTTIAANSASLGRIYGMQAGLSSEEFGQQVQKLFDAFEEEDPIALVKRAMGDLERVSK